MTAYALGAVVLVLLLFWLRGSLVGWTRRDRKAGWRRIGRSGPGLAWCLKTEPLLCSQRMGFAHYVHVGRWRLRYLPTSKTNAGSAAGAAMSKSLEQASVRVLLRDTLTNEEAWYAYKASRAHLSDPDDPEGFWWTDGNAACDCERARCLALALGRDDPHLSCEGTRVVIVRAEVDGVDRPGWRDE